MLKLARRSGQWLRMTTAAGEVIWVRPELKGERIYLAVSAPDSVRIFREETLPEEERFDRSPEGIVAGPSRPISLRERVAAIQEGRSS
jgi:sRNA-binding carbon storage regulator CsrA